MPAGALLPDIVVVVEEEAAVAEEVWQERRVCQTGVMGRVYAIGSAL